jgi:acetyl esterase/lipase
MRAMRVIRGRAQEFGIDEAKIGVMGFSAGGFIAALLSTAYESDVYADYKYKDEYDELSARPDFAVCSYPVISIDDCIEAGKRYMSEEQVLERISDSKAKILHKYNPDKLVRLDMPPVFICETDDDRTTLSENSVGFYMAARKAGVSAELHIFRTGGHGYGCGDDSAQTGEWKVLFTKWIKSIGIIS